MTDLNEWKREQRRLALEQKKQKLEEIKERSRRVVEAISPTSSTAPNNNNDNTKSKVEVSKILEDLSSTNDINSLLSRLSKVDYFPLQQSLSTPNIQTDNSATDSTQQTSTAALVHSAPSQQTSDLNATTQKRVARLAFVHDVVKVDVFPKEVIMYTKGTQTIQSKNDDFVPPPNALTDTPIKSHSHLRRHYHHKTFDSKEEPENENTETSEEAKNSEQEVVSFETQHQESPPDKPKEDFDLTPEEKTRIIESNEFREFMHRSSKIIERALLMNETYNLLTDYTKSVDVTKQQQQQEQNKLRVTSTIYEEKWCKLRSVTDLDWSRYYENLVAASFSESNSLMDPDGLVLLWDLHSPLKTPEFVFNCPSAVISVLLWPFSPSVVVGGTYSGQIVLWDMRARHNQPVMRSSVSSIGHTHPVYNIAAIGSAKANNLVSVSTDGRLCVWSIDKLSQPQEVLELQSKPSKLVSSSSVTITALAFPPGDENKFFAGAEDGAVYEGFRHGNKNGILERSDAHFGPVTSIAIHPQLSQCFLTSSVDWTCKLWNYKSSTKPIYCFEDFADYVYDVKWSPKHPALFATVDGSGTFSLWNLDKESEVALIKKPLSEKALSRLVWSLDGKRVLCGDSAAKLHLIEVANEIAVPDNDESQRFEQNLVELETRFRDLNSNISDF